MSTSTSYAECGRLSIEELIDLYTVVQEQQKAEAEWKRKIMGGGRHCK